MADRGGRRQRTWGAPMSWREVHMLETARAVSAAQTGDVSRADWLVQLGEAVLQQAVADNRLSPYLLKRATDALAGLEAERAEAAANPPRVGRRPRIL